MVSGTWVLGTQQPLTSHDLIWVVDFDSCSSQKAFYLQCVLTYILIYAIYIAYIATRKAKTLTARCLQENEAAIQQELMTEARAIDCTNDKVKEELAATHFSQVGSCLGRLLYAPSG